ncbi:MAG: TRAP transporter small permease [Alphaproteobacteria bacterium]
MANKTSVLTGQSRLGRGLAGAERLGRALLGILVLAMVLLNVASSAGRYLFGSSIPGSDELLIFAMVWLVFMGAVLITRDRGHLGFDLLRKAAPPRLAALFAMATDFVIMLVAGFIAFQSWQVVGKFAQIGQRSMALGIPMSIPHAAILLGFTLIGLVTFVALLRDAAILFGGGVPGGKGDPTP